MREPEQGGQTPFALPAPAAAILVALLAISCQYPVDTTDRNLLELERVWQYIRVFSIYTGRIPSHETALDVTYPEEQLLMLHDTLRSPWLSSDSTADTYALYYHRYEDIPGVEAARVSAAGSRSVEAHALTDSVAYIRIGAFTDDTHQELRSLGSAIERSPSLIIDLIGNPGGDLEPCKESVELFLPEGITYLHTTYRKDVYETGDTGTVTRAAWKTRRGGDIFEGKRVVLLVNRGSASSAEIFTAALRDGLGEERCTVIGERTYGKSIGQYVFRLYSGAGLKLTGFRFYRVGGPDWNEWGIIPDRPVDGTFRQWMLTAGELLHPGFGSIPGIRIRIDDIRTAVYSYSGAGKPVAGEVRRISDTPPLDHLGSDHGADTRND
jgi:hypothetical protein